MFSAQEVAHLLVMLKDPALIEQMGKRIDKHIEKVLQTFEALMKSLLLENESRLFVEAIKKKIDFKRQVKKITEREKNEIKQEQLAKLLYRS